MLPYLIFDLSEPLDYRTVEELTQSPDDTVRRIKQRAESPPGSAAEPQEATDKLQPMELDPKPAIRQELDLANQDSERARIRAKAQFGGYKRMVNLDVDSCKRIRSDVSEWQVDRRPGECPGRKVLDPLLAFAAAQSQRLPLCLSHERHQL
jgi:hypothetical protein